MQKDYKKIRIGVDLNSNCSIACQFLSYEGGKILTVNLTCGELDALLHDAVCGQIKRLFYVQKEKVTEVSGLRFEASESAGVKVIKMRRMAVEGGDVISLSQFNWDTLIALRDVVRSALSEMEYDAKFVTLYYDQLIESAAVHLRGMNYSVETLEKLPYRKKYEEFQAAFGQCSDSIELLVSQKYLPNFNLNVFKSKLRVLYWHRLKRDVYVMMNKK